MNFTEVNISFDGRVTQLENIKLNTLLLNTLYNKIRASWQKFHFNLIKDQAEFHTFALNSFHFYHVPRFREKSTKGRIVYHDSTREMDQTVFLEIGTP